ncbi:MAG TPA: hypothetical protein VLS49_12915 [Usitatibacter sp.]|nr:hypothetical protein [Usitatibacter sp.]
MRTGALLGLAALVALIVYGFTRERGSPRERAAAGDGGEERLRLPALRTPHVHAGDPSVRH